MKFREILNEEFLKKHLRKKQNGIYEIRCMIDKVAISGAGKTIDIAVEAFISKIYATRNKTKSAATESKVQFCAFAEKWFTVIKKPTVMPNTYRNYYQAYSIHIKPYFGNRQIKDITPMDIQPLFSKFYRERKMKTAQTVKFLLSQIFSTAVNERLIEQNPMNGVRILKYSPKKGKALTISEEGAFIRAMKGSRYELSFALLLFAGMRRGELRSAKTENGFLVVKDGKIRKGQEQTYRKIPITPMLAPYLQNATKAEFREATTQNIEMLTRYFKEFCPNHHLHELRHTFITRCQECGVAREVVSVWAGHSADKTMTSTVYTHFDEDFMISEGKKVDYYNRLKG